jgi:small-conductance mechanosensitive channel
MKELFQNWQVWVWTAGIILAAGVIGEAFSHLFLRLFRRLAAHASSPFFASLVRHCSAPLRWIFPFIAVYISVPFLSLSPVIREDVSSLLSPLAIFMAAWFLIRFTSVLEELILSQYRIEAKDNLEARKIATQTRIIKKIIIVIIAVLALASVLMTFEKFRRIGTGILASAGIASVVIGLAAQRIFGNFLAGIQIAFTQPFRIDDVVIVENEWGRIEEITLTYVVVRIWDLRRLVLPISYFIEKPFQNWTRVSADLLGTVFIYADYRLPAQVLREELHRILQNSAKWDGKVWGLQVTNATERVVEMRALMSARDSSAAWDLRCEVREKLIDFLQQKYPEALPQLRLLEMDPRESEAFRGGASPPLKEGSPGS